MSGRLSARSRGYTGKWDNAAAEFKRNNPYCLGCRAVGRIDRATLVDHIEPHRGNASLFWSRSNWQPSCEWHHNTVKKTLEARWDRGEIGRADLRLDSAVAIQVTKATPRRAEAIGIDGWPAQ